MPTPHLTRWLRAAALAAGLLWATPTLAWNDLGHMAIAAKAWDLMTPATRDRVHALLKLNPSYSFWVQGAADAEKGRTAFMWAATWPDFIKGAAGYKDDGQRPCPSQGFANRGYSGKCRHRTWHYINLPFTQDGTPLRDPPALNAVERINTFAATLSSEDSSAAMENRKSYDVVWLAHLVGDLHQPLHAVARFSAATPNGDKGGGDVFLNCGGCGGVLHAFWDAQLGAANGASASVAPAKAVADGLGPVSAEDAAKPPMAWAEEGAELSKAFVYQPPAVGAGAGPFSLTDDYRAQAPVHAKARAALAAARLASLLDRNLK